MKDIVAELMRDNVFIRTQETLVGNSFLYGAFVPHSWRFTQLYSSSSSGLYSLLFSIRHLDQGSIRSIVAQCVVLWQKLFDSMVYGQHLFRGQLGAAANRGLLKRIMGRKTNIRPSRPYGPQD